MFSYKPLFLHQKHHCLVYIERIHDLIFLRKLNVFHIADQVQASFNCCRLGQTLKYFAVLLDDFLKDLLTGLVFCRVSLFG